MMSKSVPSKWVGNYFFVVAVVVEDDKKEVVVVHLRMSWRSNRWTMILILAYVRITSLDSLTKHTPWYTVLIRHRNKRNKLKFFDFPKNSRICTFFSAISNKLSGNTIVKERKE